MLYICKSPDVNYVVTFCEYNRKEYTEISLWDSELDFGRNNIPDSLLNATGNILVFDLEVFSQLIEWEYSYTRLIQFLQNNSVLTTRDSEGYFTLSRINRDRVAHLNNSIPPNSIQLVTDCKPLKSYWINRLTNFNIKHLPTFTSALSETQMFRLKDSDDSKVNVKHEFMLTMIKKVGRPHRQVLWDQLSARPDLKSKGLALYHQYDPNMNGNPYHIMAGDKPAPNTWIDAYPSMDLYRSSWLEVVPETLCTDAHYFTEKTFKPMLTRTPFLIVATPGYLQYLKSLGFLTFNSLIDESYDTALNIEDRVRLMLNQLEIIIKEGTSNFYHASKHILDHNRARLAEIIGFSNYDKDLLLTRCFNEFPG